MVAIDQIKRFERWRRTLPKNTAYLVSLVVDKVVPLFEARGFDRFRDYAAGSTFAVGPNCIPLQRRSGAEWPTVEILFHKRGAPCLGVTFGVLWLFDLFDRGIPPMWFEQRTGYVDLHAFIIRPPRHDSSPSR
jgi:hypothetical protein